MEVVRLIHACTPAASARTQTFLAASMWTVVGGILAYVGLRWVGASSLPHAGLLVVGAVVVGGLKTWLVLDRSADRAVERLRRRGDGRCVGGFLSWKGWAFVLGMMLLGKILRSGLLPRCAVGLMYVAVGTALLLACRRLWAGWRGMRAKA